jgi:transcriptional regulator with XRE-family HTH domain
MNDEMRFLDMLGGRVKKRRVECGMLQRELSKVSGLGQQRLSQVELGRAQGLRVWELVRIARALNVTACELMMSV